MATATERPPIGRRSATSVHGVVLAVLRTRTRTPARARARSLKFMIVAFRDAPFTTGLDFSYRENNQRGARTRESKDGSE